MRPFPSLFIIVVVAFITTFCTRKEQIPVDLILLNATIVDVENDSITENRYITIKGDSIFSVGWMLEKGDYDFKESIDLNGKFVMPGLWDNHVHFRGGTDLIAGNQDLLGLYPKFGVTTVRDAGGDITPAVMGWQEKIAQKKLVGPYIFTSGPKLDGPKPAWEGSIKIENEEDIEKALDSLQSIAVDYVKIYDGSLSQENFYSIIEETEKRGLKC
jgi:hypothetical protein